MINTIQRALLQINLNRVFKNAIPQRLLQRSGNCRLPAAQLDRRRATSDTHFKAWPCSRRYSAEAPFAASFTTR